MDGPAHHAVVTGVTDVSTAPANAPAILRSPSGYADGEGVHVEGPDSSGGPPTNRADKAERHEETLLSTDEVSIIHGALDLRAKTVEEHLVPLAEMYMLPRE